MHWSKGWVAAQDSFQFGNVAPCNRGRLINVYLLMDQHWTIIPGKIEQNLTNGTQSILLKRVKRASEVPKEEDLPSQKKVWKRRAQKGPPKPPHLTPKLVCPFCVPWCCCCCCYATEQDSLLWTYLIQHLHLVIQGRLHMEPHADFRLTNHMKPLMWYSSVLQSPHFRQFKLCKQGSPGKCDDMQNLQQGEKLKLVIKTQNQSTTAMKNCCFPWCEGFISHRPGLSISTCPECVGQALKLEVFPHGSSPTSGPWPHKAWIMLLLPAPGSPKSKRVLTCATVSLGGWYLAAIQSTKRMNWRALLNELASHDAPSCVSFWSDKISMGDRNIGVGDFLNSRTAWPPYKVKQLQDQCSSFTGSIKGPSLCVRNHCVRSCELSSTFARTWKTSGGIQPLRERSSINEWKNYQFHNP